MPGRLLYFTATIITMDGSDTNAYGEACEPGHGYTETTGWWSPDDEPWSVHPNRDQARPDAYPAMAASPPGRWLADRLAERLGPIDHFDGGRSFYSGDELIRTSGTALPRSVWGGAIHEPRRGLPVGAKTLTAAGHAHGFTSAEIRHATHLLGLQPDPEMPTDRPAPRREGPASGRGFVALHNSPAPSAAGPMPEPTTTPGESDLPRGGRHR